MTSKKPLFTFAIVTDTHVRPPGGDDSSPFPVNDLANDRARYAIAAIARHKPGFTIHLGDMVHPLPHLPTYGAAAEEALEIFSPLRDSLRFVPGNHDIGDKPMAGSPAGPVDEETTAIYGKYFGEGHYSFDHEGIHIVTINSSLVDSGSDLEAMQREWLEADLAANTGKRIILFSHYPPFITDPDEPLHYDNYGVAGRHWLLDLVQRHKVEAVYSGHVHQFFYNRVGETKLYCLPPTSFIRQDYSELYFTGPAPEYGRNDTGKFSFALVDVFDDSHRLRVIPTNGRELEKGATLKEADPVVSPPSPTPIVVHLRHAWGRAMDMPYNGPMEEFSRKRARDDYLLLRLWQMGLSKVRTPLADLSDSEYGPRVHDYHAAGISFTFFCAGVASTDQWRACCANAQLIDTVEFVSGENDLSDIAADLAMFDRGAGPTVHVGKFHSSAHEPKRGSKFAHSVSFGFKWDDRDTVRAGLKAADKNGSVSGIVFQVNLDDDLGTRLGEMEAWANDNSVAVVAAIRLANIDPATANFDDDMIAARVEEAVLAAGGLENVSLQLDTYADMDRAYHPRHGLIDRRSNFRPAGLSLANRKA